MDFCLPVDESTQIISAVGPAGNGGLSELVEDDKKSVPFDDIFFPRTLPDARNDAMYIISNPLILVCLDTFRSRQLSSAVR